MFVPRTYKKHVSFTSYVEPTYVSIYLPVSSPISVRCILWVGCLMTELYTSTHGSWIQCSLCRTSSLKPQQEQAHAV